MRDVTSCFSYFCREYADSAAPNLGEQANECPAGFYCPSGTVEPEKCPPGTYSPTTRLVALDECLNCTGGKM